ncbi:MAG: VWA domain-containing protein [Chloroflexota bacterium]
MDFLWPGMLYSLVFVPVLVLLYFRLQHRRKQIAEAYGGFGLAQAGSGRPPGVRRHVPALLFLTGLTALFIAMARPETVVNLPRVEGIVMLAFDVSGSMAAEDVQPSRMEAAKAAARDFVERQPATVQVGVIAFSDSGFSVQPPTNEKESVLAAIERLKPERGTSIGGGILMSLSAIESRAGREPPSLYTDLTPAPTPTPTPVPQGTYSSAVIVLLTDGENTVNPDPLVAAQAAADRGVRIYTIGVGSPAGALLNVEGFTVHTQLNEPLLQQISLMTGGAYFNAGTAEELQEIYDNLERRLVVRPEKTEVTSLLAGASILFFLAGGLYSLFWFSRVP